MKFVTNIKKIFGIMSLHHILLNFALSSNKNC